jgi:peptidoglycan/LPS O-acetylase OafA/YrhL
VCRSIQIYLKHMLQITDATPSKSAYPPTTRFFTLDAVRGLAALGIVFYHWDHFTQSTEPALNVNSSDQPFYPIFKLLYDQGHLAVELFFCLSGFVFFYLYGQKIAHRTIGQQDFFIRRFARLYPLHFVALILVGVFQMLFVAQVGHSFIYPNNDLYHFVLNLLLVSGWGLQFGPSFNGVSWSISVEVLLYLTFFFSCKYFGVKLQTILFWVMLGVCLRGVNPAIGQGISSFYMGGLTYWLYQKINRPTFSAKPVLMYVLLALTGVAWLTIVLDNHYGALNPLILQSLPLTSGLLGKICTALTVLIVFPLTLLTLTLCEQKLEPIARPLAWLGDISYSVYLLHFPLQLAFVLNFQAFSIDQQIFYRPIFQVLFFILIILISLASYHLFELPLQRRLRKPFIPVH